MTPTEEQINEIAQELEMGMICYYHKKTGVLESVVDSDQFDTDDYEDWEKQIKQPEAHQKEYLVFYKMSSREAFLVMEDFTNSLPLGDLKVKLLNALNKPNPFSTFKRTIDFSGSYRLQWFEFKKQRMIEFVKTQIEDFKIGD